MLFIGWWVISYAVERHLLWGKFRGRFSVVLHNLCSCSIKWSNCNVVFVVSWFWQLDIKYFLDHWVSYNGSCRNVISACFTTFIFTDNDRFFLMFFCSFIISGLLWVSWNDDMMNYLSVKIDTLHIYRNYLTILTGKKHLKLYPSAYEKYEYGHLGRWYINLTLFKRF